MSEKGSKSILLFICLVAYCSVRTMSLLYGERTGSYALIMSKLSTGSRCGIHAERLSGQGDMFFVTT